jgi:hypothetical protein
MASRYSATQFRPSPLEAKYKQKINHISILVGAALTRLERGSTPAELFIALPPVEVAAAREALSTTLGGDYRIEFPKLNRAARVKFSGIHCFEESRMAGVAFMKQLTPDYKAGTVLSVDIGASTTDLALFVDGMFQERSARTYKSGGNTAREYLIDAISAEYDFELTSDAAEKVISTGFLQLGNARISAVRVIRDAKRKLADSLFNQTQQYFRAAGISIQSINAFLVSGGGSLSGGESIGDSSLVLDDPESMCNSSSDRVTVAQLVTDAFRSVCPEIEVIEYAGDARLANLDGLCDTARATLGSSGDTSE